MPYPKVREAGRIVSAAVIIAAGATTDGWREVLGVATDASEVWPFWTASLRSLADRGLRAVKFVIADDHKGKALLRQAAARTKDALVHVRPDRRLPGKRVSQLPQELRIRAYRAFPREHWPQIASTIPLERLNGEIEWRSDVVGIFPNEPAVVRLVGALMLEQNDEWAVSRRYISL